MAHPTSRKVLLVGIGGADWNLISPLLDAGELSFIRQMVEAGTMGDLATLSPALAEILGTSIATGKRAGKHGIHGFTEVDPETGKVRPVSSVSRRCKAVWNILQQNGLKVHVVNWFAGHPAEPVNGVAVSDFFPNVAGPDPEPWPLAEGSVHPADRAEYYAPMRVHPAEVRTDVGALFIRGLEKIDQAKDPRPGLVAAELARAFTVQAVALDILEHEPWDFLAVHFRFVDILCHLFMPFHPPRMEHVPGKLFEHYADTVNSAYRLLNLMLRKLVGRAGPEATVLVVSDHGFHHGDLRPGADGRPEMWHREQGVLLAQGPGLRRDELIHGAGVLDIAPTLLGLFGLPVGKDMDGRVLTALFEQEPEVKYLPSWEDVDGEDGMHPPGARLPEADAKVLLDQFTALGYIRPLDPDAKRAAEWTRLQNLFNLARDHIDCAAWEKALPILEELHDAQFAMPDSSLQLAFCQWRLGLTGEAERTAGDLLRLVKEGPLLSLLLGHLALERADVEQAVTHYRKAAELVKDARGLNLNIGNAWLSVRRVDEAEAAFRKVLEAEPKNALALQGLAHTHLLAERWPQAAAAALDAVALQHALPTAHAILAQALVHLGHYPDAVRACQTSLVYDPDQAQVHDALADLYMLHLKELRLALPHRTRAEELRRTRENEPGRLARLRREAEARRLALEEKALWAKSETPEDLARQEEALSERIRRFARTPEARKRMEPGAEFVIVSGLPRSGMSLMMQMLAAGRLDVMTDDVNADGAFEWSRILNLPGDPYGIEEAHGRVVKVPSMLLPHLPREHRYKVIFMDRPVEEVAASQERMLRSNPSAPDTRTADQMRPALEQHRRTTLKLLEDGGHFYVLIISYPKLVMDPGSQLERIRDFLGADLDLSSMSSAIRPERYHVRRD